MSFASLVGPLLAGQDLQEDEATALAKHLFDEATPTQIGATLALLGVKKPTGIEIAAFAREMRGRAAHVRTPFPDLVDTCGTGGGIPSFNISTAAAIIAAGAGVRIAKHGNRAVTSACGSADVLEALGVKLSHSPKELGDRIAHHGIAFLFAPAHHPAAARVGPARKELGFRTLFNTLGPLLNPAGARRQVIGVYDSTLVHPVAEALRLLGTDDAFVVHGEEGLDEVSPLGKTQWARVQGDSVSVGEWERPFSDDPVPKIAPGRDLAEAAALVREAVTDAGSSRCRACLPTAGVAILLAGLAPDFARAAVMALEAVASGAAAGKLVNLTT